MKTTNEKTYTERDARDWQRAMNEKDAEIKALQDALRLVAENSTDLAAKAIAIKALGI